MKHKIYEVMTYMEDLSRGLRYGYKQDYPIYLNPYSVDWAVCCWVDKSGKYIRVRLHDAHLEFVIRKEDFDKIFEVEKLESEE